MAWRVCSGFRYDTSERTKGTLSRFAVDRNTGHVRLLGLTETEAQPRGFAIDAQGRYLVASGEKSSTVSLYEIDGTSGNLTRKDHRTRPCLLLAPLLQLLTKAQS
jgi:6-phosphogluconolactonase (cycloisomerase 2 family)